MGKIRYSIYLYRNHDLDLITFIENHEFNFIKAVYCALTAFSNDDVFVITVPPRRNEKVINRYSYTRQLVLDTETDQKAIEVLSKIANGYRNNFLKNLLRQYLCNPISDDYLKDKSDSDFFEEKFKMFKKDKRFANAGLIKRKKAYDSVLIALSEKPEKEKTEKSVKPKKTKEAKPPREKKPLKEQEDSQETDSFKEADPLMRTAPETEDHPDNPQENAASLVNDALSFINVM